MDLTALRASLEGYVNAVKDKFDTVQAAITHNQTIAVSDPGSTRVFSGDQTAISGTDIFLTTDVTLETGVEYLVEGYLELVTEGATAEALDGIEVQSRVDVDTVTQASTLQRLWREYDNTQHVPIILKTMVTGTGAAMTLDLSVYHETAGFTQTGDSTFRAQNCVLTIRPTVAS